MVRDPSPIPFCDDWTAKGFDKREPGEQEAYVISELRRLRAEGKPLIRAMLNCAEPWAQHLANRFLREGVDTNGDPVFEDGERFDTVYLRLVPPEALDWEDPDTGETERAVAVPPRRDPQGRPVQPRDKAGKVLIAKVGNLGGNLDPKNDDATKAARAFGGDKRSVNDRTGRNLYITREVTREPRPFTFREAVTILRQWGYGVGDVVFRSVRKRADSKGNPVRGQCNWLVEEISESEVREEMRNELRAKFKAEMAASDKGKDK